MSLDGKPQIITRVIKNDKPIENEWACPCGGTVYAANSAQYSRCSRGEIRCNHCHRPARRHGRAYTCGLGCLQIAEEIRDAD